MRPDDPSLIEHCGHRRAKYDGTLADNAGVTRVRRYGVARFASAKGAGVDRHEPERFEQAPPQQIVVAGDCCRAGRCHGLRLAEQDLEDVSARQRVRGNEAEDHSHQIRPDFRHREAWVCSMHAYQTGEHRVERRGASVLLPRDFVGYRAVEHGTNAFRDGLAGPGDGGVGFGGPTKTRSWPSSSGQNPPDGLSAPRNIAHRGTEARP